MDEDDLLEIQERALEAIAAGGEPEPRSRVFDVLESLRDLLGSLLDLEEEERERRRKRSKIYGTQALIYGPPLQDAWAGPGASVSVAGIDAYQVIKDSFVEADDALRTKDVGAPSGQHDTHKDWEQVLKDVFDTADDTLRTVSVP